MRLIRNRSPEQILEHIREAPVTLWAWDPGEGRTPAPMSHREFVRHMAEWVEKGADCHIAPFVGSEGGKYFPMDQPNKYSLYRYSKAHGLLACQTCHQSMHGLYPVRYDGPKTTVDETTHRQALQFSPGGKYTGPITCGACHTVNRKGVPTQLQGTAYYNDYRASVVLIHFMRAGDRKRPVPELIKKYPYAKAQEIVLKGWE